MKIKVTKGELLECIENAVNKVVNESVGEGKDFKGRGKKQYNSDGVGKNPYKKAKYRNWDNQAEEDDDVQVSGRQVAAESRFPRQKK